MKHSRCLALVFLALFVTFISCADLPPLKLADIPIFPNAQRDLAAEAEYKAQAEADDDSPRSETIRIYSVSATPEEVARFYIQALKAAEEFPENSNESMRPGSVLPPWYEIDFYTPADFENQSHNGSMIYDGRWVKSALSRREPWANGQWLREARVMWEVRTTDNDRAEFLVAVEDVSLDIQRKKALLKTRILIQLVRTEE